MDYSNENFDWEFSVTEKHYGGRQDTPTTASRGESEGFQKEEDHLENTTSRAPQGVAHQSIGSVDIETTRPGKLSSPGSISVAPKHEDSEVVPLRTSQLDEDHDKPDNLAEHPSSSKLSDTQPESRDQNRKKRPASQSLSPKPIGKNLRNQSPAEKDFEDSNEELSELSDAPSQLSDRDYSDKQANQPSPHQPEQEILSDGDHVYDSEISDSDSELPSISKDLLDEDLNDFSKEDEESKEDIEVPRTPAQLETVRLYYQSLVVCICGQMMNNADSWDKHSLLNPKVELAEKTPWRCVGPPEKCEHPADSKATCEEQFHCDSCNMHYQNYKTMFDPSLQAPVVDQMALVFFEQHKRLCDEGLMDTVRRHHSDKTLTPEARHCYWLKNWKPRKQLLFNCFKQKTQTLNDVQKLWEQPKARRTKFLLKRITLRTPALGAGRRGTQMCHCGTFYSFFHSWQRHWNESKSRESHIPMVKCPELGLCQEANHCQKCGYHLVHANREKVSQMKKHFQLCQGQGAVEKILQTITAGECETEPVMPLAMK